MTTRHQICIEVPFGLSVSEARTNIESDCPPETESLRWLTNDASYEELPRILTAAVILMELGHPLDVALHTAIVWERG